ncbi:Kinetochore-associated protein-like protein [Hapsidospora chrysogenum ATCC 11550]|uniref:Kinetochore-associated protein-like protein n=1 Tax=Hapsidospora chrysogenum (strain ATCC 11550 / CBS 779.69 / DSM 880 / IAM 14645 / JCM 23072 / IMI 49137) TaxID=857340 RepID=A0A086THN5_HAPC1|nr:Kinetochore-associated protein-like protein [Hapsidospora chrysogenum ATCC 11550]
MATEPPQQPASQTSTEPTPRQPPAAKPATPGPRAKRFTDLYAQALDHTLGKLAWDNLSACYPTIAERAEPVLRQVQAQMVSKLGDKCAREFDSIVASRGVVAKLNELEALIGDAALRKRRAGRSSEDPTPPHLLPPQRILAAHLHPALSAHRSQLNARLQTTQSQNALLHDEVLRQRAEVEELVARLETAAGDVRGANAALAGLVEQLAAEARDGKAAVEAVEGAEAAAATAAAAARAGGGGGGGGDVARGSPGLAESERG